METAVGTGQETSGRPEGAELRRRVQDLIRNLTLEVHPGWDKALRVGDGSDLDLDLGFDSLARAELLLRLNQAFTIELPDELIVEAATVGEICKAVAVAAE